MPVMEWIVQGLCFTIGVVGFFAILFLLVQSVALIFGASLEGSKRVGDWLSVVCDWLEYLVWGIYRRN